MSEHTPTPWMTNRAGEMLPDDWMIVADMGKTPNGIQQISTVARALSIRQTPETTAANAAFIVKAVNNHADLVGMVQSLIDVLEYAQSGFISGCGSDMAWQKGRDQRIADARRLLNDLIAPRHT